MMAVCFCEQAKSNKFHGDPLVNSSTNVFFEARSGQFFVLFVVFSSFSLFSLVYILQRFFVAFFSLLELSPLDSSDIPEAKNTTIEELTRRFQCTFAHIPCFLNIAFVQKPTLVRQQSKRQNQNAGTTAAAKSRSKRWLVPLGCL